MQFTSYRRVHGLITFVLFPIAGVIVVALCCAMGAPRKTSQAQPVTPPVAMPELVFDKDDRVLVFAPHPDDETLGCGGLLQQVTAKKLPLRVCWLTYGDNNEWSFILYRKHPVVEPAAVRKMGEVRHGEAIAATKLFGLAPSQLTFLGYPDFGTLNIWNAHWGDRPAFESMLTKVREVPYPDAFRPGAPYKGQDIVSDITSVLREFKPTKVFVSHPSDHNVDHMALYLFTRIALWNLEGEMRPQLHPFLIHFAHWPNPVGSRPSLPLEPPAPLANAAAWSSRPLTREESATKEAAMRAHRSQFAYSAEFMLAFARANEFWGDFPPINLRAGADHVSLLGGEAQRAPSAHQDLTETEQAKFVGMEKVSARVEDGKLVTKVHFSKPMGEEVTATLFVFGYRKDRPFEQMPKVRINIGHLLHDALDQEQKLPGDTVAVQRHERELTVSIPLKALGDPDRALTSIHTYLTKIPLDWTEWRVLQFAP